MITYTLKVIDIRKETKDAITVCFKQPGLKKIKYLAGQYLTLILRINGRRYIRPYSFSSCPGIDDFLEITVKRVLNGVVSNHINDTFRVGDSIEVMPPMGDFTYKQGTEFKRIYLWGVGSGITPLISIAKHLLFTGDIIVNLIYGNRNKESTILLKQIEELLTRFEGRFIVNHFHTRLVVDHNNPFLIQGRIDQEKAIGILRQDKDLKDTAHYICGPAGLKESVKKALLVEKVPNGNVFVEDFELVRDPKDFDNIYTQTIEITFQGQRFELEVTKGKSILEAALDSYIELPYSCQTGNCSTCKGRVMKGELKMIGLNKEREDLAIDEYLLCCTHPLTENVQIEI